MYQSGYVYTWRISSRDDSTWAEIVQCLHDVIRPGRSGTCRRSSLVPFIPGWVYCTNLSWIMLISFRRKLENLDLKQVFTILTLFIPGRKQLRVYMENRTPTYAFFSSRDNFQLGIQDQVESCPGISFIPGSSRKRMCVRVRYGPSWTQPGTSFIPGWNPPC